MKQDIAVIGLGIFGHEVAVMLEKKGNHVLAVDIDKTEIKKIQDHVTAAMMANVTELDSLKELDIGKFDVVILGLGDNFEQLVLGITYLKKLDVKRIIARATTEIQQEILLRIGADEVILPEKQSARHLAERLSTPNLLEYLEVAEDLNVAEIHIGEKFAGKTLLELDLRKKFNITALILKRNSQKPKIITSPELRLLEDDTLVVIGSQEDIGKAFS
ncbi:MAG: TrkA family potassium uptake protein [Desulfobulbaceae bacterium]|nr:TrkA family potassium uptake protein [Desulfobulbaceae bacterium]